MTEDVENQRPFCIKSVAEQMKTISKLEDNVSLIEFVEVYEELCKFIKMLGKIFEFVEKDVQEKIILLKALHKENSEHYATVISMVEIEKGKKMDKHSGCVAILHLNRALEFIVAFMNSAVSAGMDDSIPKICKESYDETLAKHHPWIIRTAVKVAVYTLPTREKMLEYIKGSLESESEVRIEIDTVVENGKRVHERINKIYTTHDLHKIC
ncbi:unnamed protein product [Caenorhabditis angaria]|uniref:Glycolipid transfer protein domain-containing protein n=1 Tax=Caenorhabditis angaria TaxID=860376 RepID=A0A9P1I2Q6_9PELO|nr:unnamed protein product [Caenorhabditis angaria]